MTRLSALQRFLIALALGMGLASSAVYAWGAYGHTRVGAIADTLLRDHPRAAGQVRAILGNITLAQAGPWGDCIRSVTGPKEGFNYEPEPRYRPPCIPFEPEPLQTSMENYARQNWSSCDYKGSDGCHTQYHFVNMALQRPGYRFGNVGTHDYDIVQAMNAAIAVLRTPQCSGPHPSTSEVTVPGVFHFTCSQALLMLVHLIGDLHQPLHVGSVYLDENGRRVDPDSSAAERARAARTTFNFGGNSLTWPNPADAKHPNKLHSAWDDAPQTSLATAVAAARQVAATTGPLNGWVEQWANDTLRQSNEAFTGLTFGAKEGGSWPVIFADAGSYDATRRRLQRQQVAKAGARLSQLLAAIWPD